MGERLTTRDRERVETLAEISVLDVTRHLRRSGATQLETAAALALVAAQAERRARDAAELAVTEGVSYAEVARALMITRQSARTRYGHLEVVG